MKSTYHIHYLILLSTLVLGIISSLFIGEIPLSSLWTGAIERFTTAESPWNALLDERIPRLIIVICTGSALAVSGAVTQSLFNNPLASPSVLGITFGGSLLVMMTYILEWHVTHPYCIPIAAFLGCILTLLLVYGLSRSYGRVQIHSLILTGIAVSTLLLAIQGAILYALRDQWHLIQTLTEWEAGNTMNKTWKHVHMQLPLTLIGLWGCWIYRREIDLLSLGEEEALNLGVEVTKVRWRLFLCVSLLIGGTIATVGIIGFFGLVMPHLFRSIYGPRNLHLVPICTIGGACALVYLDSLLRYFQIHMLSIGNVSALLGGIFFLILLLRQQKHMSESFVC